MFSYLRGNKDGRLSRIFMLDVSAELIQKCRKQNRLAQHEMYKKCYGWLMGICQRYLDNELDRQSMVNDAFLKVFNNLDSYKLEIPFHLWIRKILINCIIDNYRKEKNYKEHLKYNGDEAVLRHGPSDDVLSTKYDVDFLLSKIAQLPSATRAVFNMYVIDGYNHEEIADILGISSGTSKWHLSNARKKLSEMLGMQTNIEPQKYRHEFRTC